MALCLFVLRYVFVLAALSSAAWAAGHWASRRLREDRRNECVALTMAIGLAVLAQMSLLCGLAGYLKAPFVATLSLGLVVVAALQANAVRARLRAVARRRPLVAGAVVLALPLFLLSLYPPLGFDETLYHLPTSRAFAAAGRLPFLPHLRYPVFPHLAEALNAAVLLVAGDVATHLVGWLALVLSAAIAFAWARDLATPAAGWIAAAALVGSPLALYLATTGYVEPLVGLFGIAALYAGARAHKTPRAGWLIMSGALAGTAAGVKYSGLFFIPAAAILWLRSMSWRAALREMALYGLAACVAAAPSYGRIVAHTGNPLFPFYPEFFGTSAWTAQEFLGPRGLARLAAASTLLWDVVFRPHNIGHFAPASPAIALGVPLGLAAVWMQGALRRPLLLTAGWLMLTPIHAHYVMGIAPLVSVVDGVAAVTLLGRFQRGRPLFAAIAVALALEGEMYAAYRLDRLGLPPVTEASRGRLLSAERPLYPAIAFLNREASRATIFGVESEHMVDYASGTLLGDLNGPSSQARVWTRIGELGSVAGALDEIGASYLLLPEHASPWRDAAARDRRLERIYADGRAIVFRVRADR
jgi:hypothetical protein